MRSAPTLIACLYAILFTVGCSGDDGAGTDTASTTPSTSNSASASATSGTTDTTSTDPTTTGSTTDATTDTDATGGDSGYCVAGCEEAVDCCPFGSMDCPGDFPNNWACNAGFCELGGCSTHEECTFGGIVPENECHENEGVGICFDPCESDADCAEIPNTTCSLETDDGTKLCALDEPGCTSDEDCDGFGSCNMESGACGCSEDVECEVEGYVCKT